MLWIVCLVAGCAGPLEDPPAQAEPGLPSPTVIPDNVRVACEGLSDELLSLAVGGIESHAELALSRDDSEAISLESCEFACGDGECEDRCADCIFEVHDLVYGTESL